MTARARVYAGPPDFSLESDALRRLGHGAVICGIDEAGRGPLAGPVVAAAVILSPDAAPTGLNDSKKLTAPRREALFDALMHAAQFGIGAASTAEIDALNILRANDLAMRRAVSRLPGRPDLALVDGNRTPPELGCAAEAVVKGDARSLSIAAASIIAKVIRDRIMARLARRHPGYGWEKNAGYPTAAHRKAVHTLGPTRHHRRSFRTIHNVD